MDIGGWLRRLYPYVPETMMMMMMLIVGRKSKGQLRFVVDVAVIRLFVLSLFYYSEGVIIISIGWDLRWQTPINWNLSMISTGCWGRTCRNKWHVQHAAVVANNGNRSTLNAARWLGAVQESTEILFRVQGSGCSRRVHRGEDADIGCNLYFGQIT